MSSIIIHQGKANQSHKEITLHFPEQQKLKCQVKYGYAATETPTHYWWNMVELF
jgi:hypothetical protein